MVHVVFFYRQTKLSNNEKHKSRHSHLNVWLAIKFSGPRSSGPNDSARDKVHIGRHGPEVDLIPLVKPNCGWRLGAQKPVPGLGFWDDLNSLRWGRRVRNMREYGKDDIEPGLLHNQARAGELHQGGVFGGA